MQKALFSTSLAIMALPRPSSGLASAFGDDIAWPPAFETGQFEAGDALIKLREAHLHEGLNFILATRIGEKLFAKVEGGSIVGWEIADAAGSRKDFIIHGSMPSLDERISEFADFEGDLICWVWYEGQDGYMHLFKVPCPMPGKELFDLKVRESA